MPDSTTTLHEIKISELPVATTANTTDQLEANQAGTTRSITVGQVAALASGGGGSLTPEAVTAAFTVPSLASLKALTTRPAFVVTQGYYTANDGGAGPPWQWVAGSTATADDFMVATPTSGTAGCYIRQIQSGDAVSPKWAGAGLAGSPTDVTAILQKVLNFGHAVDASGGTYPMLTCTITPGMVCPGIFSDGTATFIPAPTATCDSTTGVSNANGFTVTKLTAFYFRRLRFICPFTTSPTVGPVASRPIGFSASDPNYGVDWEVSDCHIEGYQVGISVGGGARNCQIKRNFITGTFSDGISGPNAMDGVYIDHNTLFDGGYASGALSPAGAIRVGVGANTLKSTHLSITHNHIARYSVNANQSSIDCASGTLTSADISHNICEDCGGSMEFKTGIAGGTYGNFNISNNLVKVINSFGITIFYSQLGVVLPKGGKFTLKGNKIFSDPVVPGNASTGGVYVNGFDNVDITSNTITDVVSGIRIDAFNVTGTATDQASNYTIAGNVIDVTSTAILRGGGTLNNLFINDNPLLKGEITGLSLSTGTTNNLVVRGNYTHARTGTNMDLRDIQTALITDNTIRSANVAMILQGTTSNNVIFEKNRIQSTAGAALQVTTANGTVFQRNTVDIPDTVQTITGAGSALTADNVISTRTTDPTGTLAATAGDIVLNGALTSGGPEHWVCVTSGTTGTAVWQARGLAATAPATTSAALAAQITDETGTGALVFANTPTLVSPLLGTPTSGNLANCTAFPTANLGGLGAGVATWLATPSTANLATAVTGETGSGALVFATSPTLVTPLLGTPTSGNLSNCTAYPAASLGGLGAGVGTWLATPTSANLATAITDETGTGALVFANTPTLVTPVLGAATATSVQIANAVAATPSLNFTGAATTGLYKETGNSVGIATNAKQAVVVAESGAAGAFIQMSSNNTPTVTAGGSAADVGLQVCGKGLNGVDMMSGGGNSYLLRTTTGGVVVANYFTISAAATTNGPLLQTVGTDTDIDLRLAPKGAGMVRFATASNIVANGTVAVTMTALGPTGASTTIREWLAVKNTSGAVRYIPLY